MRVDERCPRCHRGGKRRRIRWCCGDHYRPSDQDAETTGHQVLLSAGEKTNITVVVTAEDRTTTDTYSVTIYRQRRVLSDDADLSALSLSDVTLSPAFAASKISYTGRVEIQH